jgi:hypothetical protein
MKNSETLERISTTAKYDRVMETREWSASIPPITFPSDWQVHIVPPFAGAVVRFVVVKGDSYVSVYLDGYDMLGIENEPYWEVFTPNEDSFPRRCPLDDTDTLITLIQEALSL